MSRVWFEPTIPAFEREKTVHALDRAATVIGASNIHRNVNSLSLPCFLPRAWQYFPKILWNLLRTLANKEAYSGHESTATRRTAGQLRMRLESSLWICFSLLYFLNFILIPSLFCRLMAILWYQQGKELHPALQWTLTQGLVPNLVSDQADSTPTLQPVGTRQRSRQSRRLSLIQLLLSWTVPATLQLKSTSRIRGGHAVA
jgi:hypothetical protein